jgi:hypothetical protein
MTDPRLRFLVLFLSLLFSLLLLPMFLQPTHGQFSAAEG